MRYWYRKAHRDFPKEFDEAAEIAAGPGHQG